MDGLKNLKKNFKENFKQITEVGSGTYGKVYKVAGTDPVTNEPKYWAFKKITYSKDNEGFPQTTLREIKILKALDHENVIKLHDIVTSKPSENNKYKGSTFLIFDYMDHDLWGLMKIGANLNLSQLKCIMKQLFEGVAYIHSQNIIHRDLKSANILINNKGEVKICDFGLARSLNSLSGHYTSFVVTLWYRAPELLLGSKKYTTQVDIWSLGCIMAELILGAPLFPGDKEPRQCDLIFQMCGTPDETNWPGCRNLPYYNTLLPSNPADFHERNLKSSLLKRKPFLNSTALDFLDKLLTLNPEKRMTAKEALEHEFFKSEPLPCIPDELPKLQQECHITLMNLEKKKKEPKKPEDDSVLRKRRFNEVGDRKDRPRNDRSYAFKSPEESDNSMNPARNAEIMYNPEERSNSYSYMNRPEAEPPRQIERYSSGISNLFSQSTQASEKKGKEENIDILSSLLNSTSYKNSSQQNDNKKLHI